MLDNLSFSRFKAYFRALEPVSLPPFSGSAFRGALGHALRAVRYGSVHHGPVKACTRCSLRSECRYGNLQAYLFESPCDHPLIRPFHEALSPRMRRETYPQPFILDPPPGGDYGAGDLIALPFTLVGNAIACFPFMACALSIMGSRGVGRGRGRIQLERIVNGFPSGGGSEAESASEGGTEVAFEARAGETVIFEPESGWIVGPGEVVDIDLVRARALASFTPQASPRGVGLRFVTPFRYKYEGKLGRSLTFPIFMRNLFRRFTLLSVHSPISLDIDHGHLLSLAEGISTTRYALEWYALERYSARQGEWMNLDGFVGEIVFSGELDQFLPYLLLGELSNVGKDGSFGLGKYELSVMTKQA